MALFVHLLRILMLFLNIYDSYKTLRLPPPSSRNDGRPSQRALVQRKRNMKGCLAVWIVWMCIITYEGYVEGLVSLFVPFYDEIKSLGLLFLIMTRARGAEPIFLNFIRPLVKPYSPTIDLVLDLARMFGDILFVVLAIPTEYVHMWYKKFVPRSESLYTETESDPTSTASTMPVPNPTRVAENGRHGHRPVCFPKEKKFHRQPSGDSDHQPSRSHTRVDQVGQRAQARTHLDPHQIWYPPPASYSDEEDTREAPDQGFQPPSSVDEMRGLLSKGLQEHKTVDEWRQYPAFPSAYPPTPIVVSTASLPSHSTAATHLPNSLLLAEIPEEAVQQDFSKSLLPPRKPLNSGFVKGLSDEIQTPGVHYDRLESMSADSYSEDEDSFNTTLQTPMPPLPATRSAFPIDRGISVTSSVATQATALTTGTRNSLETQSSIESLSSAGMSDLPSVLGKKRSFPLDVLDFNTTSQIISGRNGTREVLGDNAAASQRLPISGITRTQIDVVDGDAESTFSTTSSVDDQKPKVPKRRKISQSPKRKILVTRPKVTRHVPAPTKGTIPKKVPTSSRDAPGRSTKHHIDGSVISNASRTKPSFSIDKAAKKTTRDSSKNVVKESRGQSRKLP
ncbi:hypothetical protein C0992_003570 [Termitomyces sp. T32_za158]|nr:hypothetical protein C0992_003570 [Termitomyces sp. T32_za158]